MSSREILILFMLARVWTTPQERNSSWSTPWGLRNARPAESQHKRLYQTKPNQARYCLRRMKRHQKKAFSAYRSLLAQVGSCVTLSAPEPTRHVSWPTGPMGPEQGRLLSTICTRTSKVLSAVRGYAWNVQSAYCVSHQRARQGTAFSQKLMSQKPLAAHTGALALLTLKTMGLV